MTSKKELERSYATMANWALVLSIASWLILGIILAPAGMVLGAKALKSESGATRATATIAMIVSGVGLAIFAITFMAAMAAISYR